MENKKGKVREYTESLLLALLIAFFLRSFVVEAFKIPSGSMIPTLVIGDHIFVNKFVYGLRVPFTKKWMKQFRHPERGEVIVFGWPVDESKDFIKRVVGLPGDKLRLEGDKVFVNDQLMTRDPIQVTAKEPGTVANLSVIPNAIADGAGIRKVPSFDDWSQYDYFIEKTGGVDHLAIYDRYPNLMEREILVPPDQFFVMGDNRDNSADSRAWGFVPVENIKGKALFVWLSLDLEHKRVRWERFGKGIE
ncbi:MAG: signal peptidase I [bacterium]|nr:signal peptidase I [bacterium]